MSTVCKVQGCNSPARYVGSCMCPKHHWRQRTHGSTDKPVRPEVPRAEKIARALEQGLAASVEVGDCLEWTGFFMCKGVTPIVKIRDRAKNASDNLSVPRLLWEREHGPIPAGKLVYRRCCNNACVLHLQCGTRADWAKARKRAAVTAHSAVAKIALTLAARKRRDVTNTIEKAREVRLLTAAGAKIAEIAAQTGVHPTVVAEIRQGRSWRELGASPFAGLGA